MIWRIATPEDFANEDWEFEHYRYLDGTKLETQYWDVKDGYLQKKSGTGTLPFDQIEILQADQPGIIEQLKELIKPWQKMERNIDDYACAKNDRQRERAMANGIKIREAMEKNLKEVVRILYS